MTDTVAVLIGAGLGLLIGPGLILAVEWWRNP